MRKNIQVTLLVLLIILLSASNVTAAELPDARDHWAEDYIRELVALGAISGYPDGFYRPENTITRAEFSSVLGGALGLEKLPGATFTDTFGHWGLGRIEALVKAGVIDTGLYGQYYQPNSAITREEIAMMTVGMLTDTTNATDIPFWDNDQVSTGYEGYVAEAYARGIIRGYPDTTFRPKGTATRAEAAVMVVKALRIKEELVEEPLEPEEPEILAPVIEPHIYSFTSDKTSLLFGGTATLSWVTEGGTVTIDPNVGNVDPIGSVEVSPSETTTYTLTTINSAGSDSAEVTITVTSFEGILPPPDGIMILPPTITEFSADKSGMTEGTSTTLSWDVSGIATVTIEPGIGEVDLSGSRVVTPADNTTYTLTASNVSGSTTKTVTIKVRPPLTIQPGPGDGKDTFISRKYDENYSHHHSLLITGEPTTVHRTSRALLQFNDVDSFHPNTVITSAVLQVYVSSSFGKHDGGTFEAYGITSPWDLNEVRWSNPVSFDNQPESSTWFTRGDETWLSWDLTTLAQGWVDDSIPNHGVLLGVKGPGTSDIAIFCHSSNYADNPALRPKLVLTYYTP